MKKKQPSGRCSCRQWCPSFATCFTVVFLGYVGYSMFSMYTLVTPGGFYGFADDGKGDTEDSRIIPLWPKDAIVGVRLELRFRKLPRSTRLTSDHEAIFSSSRTSEPDSSDVAASLVLFDSQSKDDRDKITSFSSTSSWDLDDVLSPRLFDPKAPMFEKESSEERTVCLRLRPNRQKRTRPDVEKEASCRTTYLSNKIWNRLFNDTDTVVGGGKKKSYRIVPEFHAIMTWMNPPPDIAAAARDVTTTRASQLLLRDSAIRREIRVPKSFLVSQSCHSFVGCACETVAKEKEEEEEERGEDASRIHHPSANTTSNARVYPHWIPSVTLGLVTEQPIYPSVRDVPELARSKLRLVWHRDHKRPRRRQTRAYLPVSYADMLATTSDAHLPLTPYNRTSPDFYLPLNVTFASSSVRRWLLGELLTQSLRLMQESMGAADRDGDDIRRLMTDTSPLVLLTVLLVSTLHLLFDVLAFKNDIRFWRNLRSTKGLSVRSMRMSFFCEIVVLIFLWHNDSSLLILAPATFSVGLSAWKNLRVRAMAAAKAAASDRGKTGNQESSSERHDRVAASYLGSLLYPLCAGFSAYSLLCIPHESAFSWMLHSAVKFVYTFGMIAMTPQLYLNYRLKSVAHLPWRFLIYRALNTFIDDIFAFIITMPTAHRLSCFRDDVVFFVYMYQRWIYPVDTSRPSVGGGGGEGGAKERAVATNGGEGEVAAAARSEESKRKLKAA